MQCPHCESMNTRHCKSETVLGYRQFRCRSCNSQYNERTGTSYNKIHYPIEVITFTLYLYYRFRNSLDDAVELMITRGVHISHQTVYNWVYITLNSRTNTFEVVEIHQHKMSFADNIFIAHKAPKAAVVAAVAIVAHHKVIIIRHF